MRISLFGPKLLIVLVFAVAGQAAHAGDLKITLPRRSKLTPVQRLNQEGVDAVRKQQYEKANALFYKAYLYDPDDPFTLNNLGYMAELNGQVDRAQQFYDLASQQATDAVIDRSSSPKLKGESFRDEVAVINDQSMQISRANVSAVHLLSQGRSAEAEALLLGALAVDPHNAFTLNNLGVTKETEGDLESAVKYYAAAADTHSTRPIVVTFNQAWRGKSVSEMAADSARELQERIRTETAQERAARLNFRGVTAINRNDWRDATENFRAAYSLDPNNAFSLNNLGYVAEAGGDPETAQFFYQKARQANGAGSRVDLATGRSAEGIPLFEVSSENGQKVGAKLAEEAAARRQEPGPVQLKHRDNTPVIEPTEAPPATTGTQPASPASSPSMAEPTKP
jgi:Flp pilus assembly protein TadD